MILLLLKILNLETCFGNSNPASNSQGSKIFLGKAMLTQDYSAEYIGEMGKGKYFYSCFKEAMLTVSA